MKHIPVVAHRGLSRLYPENTLSSVLGALDAGLDKVEIDIQMSADGVPVVHHDADLLRMSGRGGDLRKRSWAQLKKIYVGEPGRFGSYYAQEKLCSLRQLALALTSYGPFTLFVELKEESLIPFGREAMLAAVAEALQPIHQRCVLISFDIKVLQLARRDTRFPLGVVLRNVKQLKGSEVKQLKPEWIFCDHALVPKTGALRAIFGASKTCVYEVPQVDRARALLKRGIHALETFKGDSLAQELAVYR